MLTEHEVAQRLAHAEASHDLYTFTLDGVALWRLLRARVGHEMQGLGLQMRVEGGRAALMWRGISSFLGFVRALLGRRRRYIVKTYSSALRSLRGGRYADIYFDALLKQVPGGGKWSFCNSAAFASRARQADIAIDFDTTFIQIASALLARMWPFDRNDQEFNNLAAALDRAFGSGFMDAEAIRTVYAKFRWQVWFYSLLVRRLKPSAVLVADTGEYALLHAAQRNGVRFVELQHGIFSPDHPDALPASALGQTDLNLLLPDVLAVYGEYWLERLENSALVRLQRVVPCGSSAIEEYRGERSCQLAARAASQPLQILLTTQGFSVRELVGFIREFLDICEIPLVLSIKLHPIYDDEKAYQSLAPNGRVRILTSTDQTPTHSLIAQTDVHVSISSACHYDALAIGVPTVVLGLPGHELMLSLIDSGDARLVGSPQELMGELEVLAAAKVSAEKTERFCRSGFVENIGQVAGLYPAASDATGRY